MLEIYTRAKLPQIYICRYREETVIITTPTMDDEEKKEILEGVQMKLAKMVGVEKEKRDDMIENNEQMPRMSEVRGEQHKRYVDQLRVKIGEMVALSNPGAKRKERWMKHCRPQWWPKRLPFISPNNSQDYAKVPSGPWDELIKTRKSEGQVRFQFTLSDLEIIYESGRKHFSDNQNSGEYDIEDLTCDEAMEEPQDVHKSTTCCGLTLYEKDIQSLEGWLSDAVVNCMLRFEMMKEVRPTFVFDSHFCNKLLNSERSTVEEVLRENWHGGEDLRGVETILFPFCTGTHWVLFVCVPHIKELWVMCSMGEDYDVSKLIRYLKEMLGFEPSKINKKVPLQVGGTCGYNVIHNGKMIMKMGKYSSTEKISTPDVIKLKSIFKERMMYN